jgi:hypothetical protein
MLNTGATVYETFPNGCAACAQMKAVSYTPGACPGDLKEGELIACPAIPEASSYAGTVCANGVTYNGGAEACRAQGVRSFTTGACPMPHELVRVTYAGAFSPEDMAISTLFVMSDGRERLETRTADEKLTKVAERTLTDEQLAELTALLESIPDGLAPEYGDGSGTVMDAGYAVFEFNGQEVRVDPNVPEAYPPELSGLRTWTAKEWDTLFTQLTPVPSEPECFAQFRWTYTNGEPQELEQGCFSSCPETSYQSQMGVACMHAYSIEDVRGWKQCQTSVVCGDNVCGYAASLGDEDIVWDTEEEGWRCLPEDYEGMMVNRGLRLRDGNGDETMVIS